MVSIAPCLHAYGHKVDIKRGVVRYQDQSCDIGLVGYHMNGHSFHGSLTYNTNTPGM